MRKQFGEAEGEGGGQCNRPRPEAEQGYSVRDGIHGLPRYCIEKEPCL